MSFQTARRYKGVKKSSNVEITEEYIGLSLDITTKFPKHESKLRMPKTRIGGKHGSMASSIVFLIYQFFQQFMKMQCFLLPYKTDFKYSVLKLWQSGL